jgi:coenzyme F420-0:L-glutamate ligase / coenzyme F420-1:gamma-L-glutamate ligase
MSVEITAPDGVPEVRPDDDLAGLLAAVFEVADGDVVVITSKVVSKAEGRMRRGDRDEAVAEETVRLVARRGLTSIVRNRLGLTMAAAGVDASNVELGWIVLLPEDPDASARRIRAELHRRTGHNVAVIVTDTAGRAWRTGQTDIAIGAAGLVVSEDFHGRQDAYGNPLFVTELAVADELAGAAELAQGKLAGRPFAIVRGRPDLVLPPTEDGPGAAALIRAEGADLFGYGAREAVVAAARGSDGVPFGEAVDAAELAAALARAVDAHISVDSPTRINVWQGSLDLVRAIAFVHGWEVADDELADERGDNDSAIRLRFPGRTT